MTAFSVGATGADPLRPPPAVVTISDAITTANQPRIDGLYRKKAERNATKKPNGKAEYEEKTMPCPLKYPVT